MLSDQYLFGIIPDINIWRVANLMIKRYGDLAEEEARDGLTDSGRSGMRPAWRSGAGLWVQSGSL